MNKDKQQKDGDEMRNEYDLSKLKGRVRGKYAERYNEGTNLVALEADVHDAFPTSDSVNEALRMLMKVAREHVKEKV